MAPPNQPPGEDPKPSTEPDVVEGWPPGHFYSPIPNLQDVRRRAHAIFDTSPRELAGIDLNEAKQLSLFEELARYYPEQPFSDDKSPGRRYFFNNPNFSYGDAIILYCLIRHLRPRRIVEVGSGYSSCVILDTIEQCFSDKVECTFIEPYPQLLTSLLKPGDVDRIRVVPAQVQDVPLTEFTGLGENDILFIDSTHVSKVGSDVNTLLFDVLPALRPGVYVHIHDIYFPFEYPKEWVYQGRAWNEGYMLRAFLQYNRAFEIIFFNAFFGLRYAETLAARTPLCAANPGGGLWLRKR
jgi:predicted O-methyltransferase YrrM